MALQQVLRPLRVCTRILHRLDILYPCASGKVAARFFSRHGSLSYSHSSNRKGRPAATATTSGRDIRPGILNKKRAISEESDDYHDRVIQYFATCAPGLEEVVASELRSSVIGAEEVTPGRAGVQFQGSIETGYRANLWLRAAVRVLMLLAEAPLPGTSRRSDSQWSDYSEGRGPNTRRQNSLDGGRVGERYGDDNDWKGRGSGFRDRDGYRDREREWGRENGRERMGRDRWAEGERGGPRDGWRGDERVGRGGWAGIRR